MKNSVIVIIALFAFCRLAAQEIQPVKTDIPGFVDMHTHPRSDLAYGAELFFGCPYGDISKELENCSGYHAGWSLKNRQGNVFRQKVAEQTEQQYYGACVDLREGYPNFTTWPAWYAVLHQQMWVDWIERAHEGGLNIMVALVAHSHCIADAAETRGPNDDESVILSGVQGIKDLVANSGFMEIALNPGDVRRIVGQGKLTVIAGIEMENIGNFYDPPTTGDTRFNPNPSHQEIQQELDKLWDLGVRYIFPIHITNNIFGGAAIYVPPFNVPNKYNTGSEFIPENISTAASGIGFKLTHPVLTFDPEAEFVAKVALRMVGGILPKEVNPSRRENYTFWDTIPGQGHRNSLGLTEKGKFAVRYMMQKGFMIDIDHMSEKMTAEVLEMAIQHDYPVNSGHCSLRGENGSEMDRTPEQFAQIKRVGGMIGLGHCNGAANFVPTYRKVLNMMDFQNVAIGSDANGFYPLPRPDEKIRVDYEQIQLSRCTTGNRTWDINSDGFAHYGLFPDFNASLNAAGMTGPEKDVYFNSAEHFTRMWEKCERRKAELGK